MDVFKWIKDIEDVYEDLINKAKDVNLKDIEDFRELQRKTFENFLSKKNELVNNAFFKLTSDVDSEIKMFRDKMNTAIKKIEHEFENNIQNLQKLIITEAELDF